MPRRSEYMPRECLTRWPGGTVKPGIEQPWADKAVDMAAWVLLMEARIKRNNTNIAALTRQMGVSRATLDSMMLGKSWPGFDLFTSMARAMHYQEIWSDFAKR